MFEVIKTILSQPASLVNSSDELLDRESANASSLFFDSQVDKNTPNHPHKHPTHRIGTRERKAQTTDSGRGGGQGRGRGQGGRGGRSRGRGGPCLSLERWGGV